MGPGFAVGAVGLAAGTQAFGSILAGRQQARERDFEAQQLEIQRTRLETAADIEEAERRDDLASTIQSIEAVRGARGLGASPTGFAALRQIRGDAQRDIRTARMNRLIGAESAGRAASERRRAGRSQQLAGFLGAGTALGVGAFRGSSLLG